ncbi:hypothetical protein [Massilibacterium senegalense]|uniref:hypothetical protein n=1 Tax=Massilibacterium senegalense TaxID=1632858 RepID=UPI0007819605|nr:hypothetical protein [Massilibacterium senegalense]
MIDVKKINETITELEQESKQLKETLKWQETMADLRASFEKLVTEQEKIVEKLATIEQKDGEDKGKELPAMKAGIEKIKHKQQEQSQSITSQINHGKIANEQLYQRTKEALDAQQTLQLQEMKDNFERFTAELHDVKKSIHDNMSMYEYNLKIRSDRLENKNSMQMIGISVIMVLILVDIIVRLFS